jgi:predicted regulator of Ras-like GTPase activity (Roadblock/LC7/MglB family)
MLPATTVAAPGRLVGDLDLSQRADDLPERLDRDQRRRSVRTAMSQLSAEARDLNWLVGTFAKRTPGMAHAMVVSADGLPMAVSDRLDQPKADQLAAIASGLASLTQGSAGCIDGGLVKQTVVEMDRGLLVVMAISDGSCLTVLAASSCDVGVVTYQMTVLITRTGDVLTPSLRAELQAALPS